MSQRQISPSWYASSSSLNWVYQVDGNGNKVNRTRRWLNPVFEAEMYAERVRQWSLDVARSLRDDRDAEFVVLQIVVAQIEGLQTLMWSDRASDQVRKLNHTGIGSWKKMRNGRAFIAWLRRRTRCEYTTAYRIWKSARNALFHTGFTGRWILLRSSPDTRVAKVIDGVVYLDPHALADEVDRDLGRYIQALRRQPNKQRRFMKKWLALWDINENVQARILNNLETATGEQADAAGGAPRLR